jgi:DNA (cytosine-5)-methyltransferase 1
MNKLRVLDLFSGIGGFSIGLERTGGFETVAFCEIEPFPRRVLAKHWPGVPCYHDVRELTAERLAADGIGVDAICGGFPCQDISLAGKGAGMDGERSGLWSEYARLIGELRPRYVIVENVAALLGRGLDRVLRDLAALGFDAEWHCIPASAVGAPHRRDRLWIIAHPNGDADGQQCNHAGEGANYAQSDIVLADAASERRGEEGGFRRHQQTERAAGGSEAVADANSNDVQRQQPRQSHAAQWQRSIPRPTGPLVTGVGGEWLPEPDVGRVVDGFPARAHRLRALGNSVVPQIPELIGRAILAAEAA